MPPDPASGQRPATDDTPPRRPRWLGVLLVLTVVLMVAGLLMSGWFMLRTRAPASAAREAVAPTSGSAVGLARVQASDCMRCHLPARKAVGPSYQAIAERHASNPEAVAFLAQKIRNGSVGDWGRVIMPRHPQIDEADARLMAQWVLDQRLPVAGAPARP
ncbi:MAG: cytochrome C [Comamonadaceae bacterium]|nr:MAG: cytochrome C [Comamonadaceae bacterium]